MKQQLKGMNIIVTGGNGGIGSVVVDGFLQVGANVLVVGPIKSPVADTVIADVSDQKQLRRVSAYIKKSWSGKVDGLVNAAGIYGPMGKLEDLDLNFWQRAIAINLIGTVNMCALVIPFMKKRRSGKIINFSGGGDGPFPRFTAYSSSKAAVLRFTESLASELAEYNIFVNAVAPGPINTRLLEQVLAAGEAKVGKDFYKASKKQKADGGTSPTKVRDLILFLASKESGSMSGKMISAVHDDWKSIPKHLKILNKTDIYNMRRIKPKDRGYDDW